MNSMVQPRSLLRPKAASSAKQENKTDIDPTKRSRNTRVSLKQWRILHAVIECGSFANAAEFLHLSQPTISYTITKLEEQIGVPLLKLVGRKHKLTEAGIALLERSRSLLQNAVALEEFAANLGCGKQEIRIAVDQTFPTRVVIPALRAFEARLRHIAVTLTEVSMPQIIHALHHAGAEIAISSQIPTGFDTDLLIDIEYVAVAHPDHPLFDLGRAVTQADLAREVRVVSTSEAATFVDGMAIDPGPSRRWMVNNFDTAESAVTEGIGYGWLPKKFIKPSLDSGKLRILPLHDKASYKVHFYLVQANRVAQSVEMNRLVAALQDITAGAGPVIQNMGLPIRPANW